MEEVFKRFDEEFSNDSEPGVMCATRSVVKAFLKKEIIGAKIDSHMKYVSSDPHDSDSNYAKEAIEQLKNQLEGERGC